MATRSKPSLLDTIKALSNRRMLYLLLLGISSGLPFALTLGTLQAWMKDLQIDLKTIGLFAFLRLPFSLKFLWSPFMDRYTPPFLDRRRAWAALTQVAIACCLVGMAFTDPLSQITQLVILTLLVNFFSASQDIALDAYRRDILKDEELGLGVSVFVNGWLVAARYISGALALYLASSTNFLGDPKVAWSYSEVYFLMAAFMGILVLASFGAPKISSALTPPRTLQEAFIGPIKDYFGRPEALTILAFIVLYKMGDSMASTMTLPFIKELGFSNTDYVAVTKLWGPIMTFVGTFIGGHLVYRFGIVPSLWIMGFFQAASTAAFALLQFTGKSVSAFAAVIAFENLTAQMGTAAYAAYMASVTNKKFTATQFALLSSLMAVPGVIFASRTGFMAQQLGWVGFFVGCGLMAIPGMFLIPMLNHTQRHDFRGILRIAIIAATVLGISYAAISSLIDILKMF